MHDGISSRHRYAITDRSSKHEQVSGKTRSQRTFMTMVLQMADSGQACIGKPLSPYAADIDLW